MNDVRQSRGFPRSKRLAVAAAATLWALAAAAGTGLFMGAAFTPSAPADARSAWPAALDEDAARTPARPTLVLCLHPRCPCSDATLDELAALLAAGPGGADVRALFPVPDDAGDAWETADLVVRARSMAGLRVVIDRGGRRCAALGARTSGQAFVYDAAGRLAFAGGLTPGRGERGATPGSACVAAALAGRPLPAETRRTPVFGCALYRGSAPEMVR